jgi:hypothetical protein
MNKSFGVLLMNIAVAAYLCATGIIGLTGRKLFSDGEIRKAVTALFGRGDFTEILIVVFAILAIAAGVFILLKFFGIIVPSFELILFILALAWLVFIVMIDIISPLKEKKPEFVEWLRIFGAHLMVFAGLVLATERFGRKK